MSERVTIKYYGVEGSGRTLTEAKRDAGNQIESMMADGFTPSIVACAKYPDLFALIHRDGVNGWAYKVLRCSQLETGRVWAHGNYASREDAEKHARNHLAQNAMVPADPNQTGLEFLLDRYQRIEHIRYIGWQRAYIDFRARGFDDVQSHRLACELGSDAIRQYTTEIQEAA